MFTIETVKMMLREILRETPDKFYAAIFTIARDGIEDVTKEELPATIAVLATEVRCEGLLASVRRLAQHIGKPSENAAKFTLEQRMEALARRLFQSGGPRAESEAETRAPAESDADYGGPPADAEEASVRALFAAASSGPTESARAGVGGAPESASIALRSTAAPKSSDGTKTDGAVALPSPNVPITVLAPETK